MSYYFSTKIAGTFAEALGRTRDALQIEGFGIISEIDIQKTLREKIGVEFGPYVILGACNPKLAYEALRLENKVGTMLPCNVVVQEVSDGIEIAAVNPIASMQAIQNERLREKAAAVAAKLNRAIVSLAGQSGIVQADQDEHRAEIQRHADESRQDLDSIVPHGTDPLHEGP